MNKTELSMVNALLRRVRDVITNKGMPMSLARTMDDAINAVDQVILRQSRKKS